MMLLCLIPFYFFEFFGFFIIYHFDPSTDLLRIPRGFQVLELAGFSNCCRIFDRTDFNLIDNTSFSTDDVAQSSSFGVGRS